MKSLLRSTFAAALCAGLAASAFADAPSAADVQAAAAAHAALSGALAKADFGTVWKGLPASYKAAAADAVKDFAGKMDPQVWKLGQDTVLQIAATLVKQNGLIVGMGDEAPVPVPGSGLVKGGAKLGAIARAATLEKLAKGDLQALLDTPALTMKGVTDAVADIKLPTYTASANEDGSVTMTNSANPEDKDRMVKVEGVWIPEDVADAFKQKDTWKAAVAKMKPLDEAAKQQATMVLTAFQGAAKNAGKATTKEELQGALMQAMMPLMMMGGMGGGDAGVGFGDDEDEDDEVHRAATTLPRTGRRRLPYQTQTTNRKAHSMADKFPKTKVRIIRFLADKTDLTQAQVASVIEELAKLAYAGAKEKGGFPVPGLGKVSMIQRKARTGFNPRTQEKIQIPAKTVVKFRLSKTAKDAILAK